VGLGGLAGSATSARSHNEAPAGAPAALGGAEFAAVGGGGAAAVSAKRSTAASVAEADTEANGSNDWSYAMAVAALAITEAAAGAAASLGGVLFPKGSKGAADDGSGGVGANA
jgi:hypothetical protein